MSAHVHLDKDLASGDGLESVSVEDCLESFSHLDRVGSYLSHVPRLGRSSDKETEDLSRETFIRSPGAAFFTIMARDSRELVEAVALEGVFAPGLVMVADLHHKHRSSLLEVAVFADELEVKLEAEVVDVLVRSSELVEDDLPLALVGLRGNSVVLGYVHILVF